MTIPLRPEQVFEDELVAQLTEQGDKQEARTGRGSSQRRIDGASDLPFGRCNHLPGVAK
jgi:hypothetical protein